MIPVSYWYSGNTLCLLHLYKRLPVEIILLIIIIIFVTEFNEFI